MGSCDNKRQLAVGDSTPVPAAVLSTNGLAYVVGSATGVTNHYAYDALGRRVAETGGRGNTVRTAYDALGRVASVTDAAGFATVFGYDALGRRVTSTDPLGNATHTAYDNEGRTIAQWGATYPVVYAYDAFGDLATLTTFRDASAPLSPELGDTTRWLRDAATGLVTNKLYADGLGPSYTYTPDGKLASRTWARGIVTEYSYDLNGSLTNVVYSDGTPSIAYAYDNRGNLITATVDGVSTNLYAYDVFGNLTNEVQNGTVIARDYDAFGRPTGYALGSGGAGGSPAETDANVAYSYDTLGRFASVTFGTNVFEYSRLPGTDLVTGYTCGSFSRSVSYKPHRDLVSAVSNFFGSARVSTFGYANDAAGRRTAIARGGSAIGALAGASDAYGYNTRSEVTSARRTLSGAEVSGFAFDYAYDPIGNRTSATEYDENGTPLFEAYAANELNQYTSRTVPGYAAVRGEADTNAFVTVNERPVARTGAYFHGGDYADNTLSNLYADLEIYAAINPSGTNVPDTVYSVTTSVFVAKTPETFTYDADGNMTSDGRFTYTWNADNRMVMASNDAVVVTYAYDHRGRMVRKEISRGDAEPQSIFYTWDNWNIIREQFVIRNSSFVIHNVWGLDLDGTLQGAGGVGGLLAVIVPRPMGEGQGEGGTACLPCYDANGNITEYVSTNGEVVAHYDYSPFGEQLIASGPLASTFTHRFSTKPWCAVTKFSEYQMRKYRSDISRWMSRDPMSELFVPMEMNDMTEHEYETDMFILANYLSAMDFRPSDPLVGRLERVHEAISANENVTMLTLLYEVELSLMVGNNPINAIDVHGLSSMAIALPVGGACALLDGPLPIMDIIVLGIIGYIAITEPDEPHVCKPCVPPVGSTAFEVHHVPPSRPHWPFKGTHTHHFKMHQSPWPMCKCFWDRNSIKPSDGISPYPGEISFPGDAQGGGIL